jgi:hypothetical protein
LTERRSRTGTRTSSRESCLMRSRAGALASPPCRSRSRVRT